MTNAFNEGLSDLEESVESAQHVLADEMAHHFTEMMNDWHGSPEVYDDALDSQIHKWYVRPPKVIKKDPFFSPSSANADSRMLYEKLLGSSSDTSGQPPYQGRWTRIGTSIGDIIQRDILFIEKHVKGARFKFERTENETPMFEEFAKANVPVRYKGKSFYLSGSPDGVMLYTTDEGETIRVGLEIKSKQTTYAKTGNFGMKGPEESHVEQCKVYAMMYGLDYYIVLYVNASKKSWFMTAEDVIKYPDIRAFGVHITKEDKLKVLDRFVDILDAVERRDPPNTDLGKWTFNGYKDTIAKGLSEEHLAELIAVNDGVQRSRMKDHEKRNYQNALDDLLRRRGAK